MFLKKIKTLLILGVSISICGAESSTLIEKLPELSKPEAWGIKSDKPGIIKLKSLNDFLEVEFNANKGNSVELLLKKTVVMPDFTRGFYFLCTNNGIASSLRIDVIAKDKTGRKLIFYTKSERSWKQGLFIPEHGDRRNCERLFSTPGLKDEKSLQPGNYTPEDKRGYNKPKRPYTLIGLRFRGNSQRGKDNLKLYLKDFVLSGLTPKNAKLYYQFKKQEFYGEISGTPYITLGELFKNKWGKKFDLCWELRDKYSGQPFMTGSKIYLFDDKKAGFSLKLAEHIQIPVKEKGTYWLKVKTRWSKKDQPVPEILEEKEFRLYIDKGDKKTAKKTIAPDFFEKNNFIKIAPNKKEFVFENDEKFVIPVLFKKPEVKSGDLRAVIEVGKVEVKDAKGDTVKKLEVSKILWDEKGNSLVKVDLDGFKPGSYQVVASLFTSDNKLFDRSTQLIGRREKEVADSALGPIPDSVLSWQEQLESPEPIMFITPLLSDSDGSRKNPKLAWDKYYKPFLDEAGGLSKYVEHQICWAKVEKLPGVYDWSSIDRFVDYAGKKGLKVNLYAEILASSTPEWVPSIYSKNPEGEIFGHKAYLFHGGRINFLLAPEIRDRMIEFFKRLVIRYRTNPTVMGYYLCIEHPRDAPYTGWYEGFSEESRKIFAAYCEQKWKDIKVVNKRWGTDYKSFADIKHPNKNSSARYRTDWLMFRIDAIEKLYKDFVKTIRKYDQKRLIVVYTDGPRDFRWFRDHGCMTADGGSQNAMGVLKAKEWGANGYHRRTEDHNPGYWTAYFSSQIEASLFAISTGGAYANHCRAFIRTDKKSVTEQLQDKSKDLGKLQKLWPIWEELHDTKALPVKSFVLGDMASMLAKGNTTCVWTTYGGPWVTLNVQAAHLNSSLSESYDLWSKGKLLMALTSSLEYLEDKTMDEIVDYVKDGGTFFMLASVGRKSIDREGEDWALLKKFGFNPPEEKDFVKRYSTVVTMQSDIFKTADQKFTVRDYWCPKLTEANGKRVAFFDKQPETCALSWKPFGKGNVAVLWGREVTPPRFSKNHGGDYPFLKDIAEWAGVKRYSDSTNPMLWTNLLISEKRDCYYGMVHVPIWNNVPAKPETGNVKWFLPEGKYEVTELITGKSLGTMNSETLSKTGIEVTLGPREVGIYRMKRLGFFGGLMDSVF